MTGPRPFALAALLALASGCSDDGGTTSSGGTGSTTGPTSSSGSGGAGGASGSGGAGATTTTGAGGQPVDPFAGPVKSLTELDFGEGAIGKNILFDLPDRMIGLTVLAETAPGTIVGVYRLRPPGTSSVVSQYAIPGVGLKLFADYGSIAAADPQSDLPDAWPVKQGNWLLLLGSDVDGVTARTRMWVRRTEDGVFHGGAVDVNVFIAPGAADQAYMNTTLSKLFNTYFAPKIGLTLGNVAYFTASAGFSDVSTRAEYDALLASSTGVGSAPALNLFVVGSMSGDFQNALGVAGGVPGSPMVHGTKRSGVAYTPTGDTGYDASVLAHEVGHLAGLFHTSEYQIAGFDPLADTPTCPNIMNTNPTNCPDVSNVMFPVAYGGSIMTTWQARVMQGSALYRGALTEGGPFSPPLSPAPPSPSPSPLFAPTPSSLKSVVARSPRSDLERTLTGHFCARSPEIVDVLATQSDPSELLGLAADTDAFDVTRAHAISVLARMSETTPSGDAATELRLAVESVLADPDAGRQAILAAARAAASIDVETALRASDVLAASPDPIVRAASLSVLP